MKNKIITAFFTIFFIVVFLNLNNVFGIGVIGQSWKITSNGQNCLLFRVFTTPHSSLLKKYHSESSTDYVENGIWKYKATNGKKYTSKWVDATNIGYDKPAWYTFKTIGFVFHTEQMGDYNSKSDPYIGYNSSNKPIGSEISTIKETYNTSEAKYTTPKTVKDYDDVKFFELMKSTGTYNIVNWGTGLTINNIQHANYLEYRYAIVEIDGHNVLINDYIIYEDNLRQLIEAAKKADSAESCYISNIITSMARGTTHSGEVEVARTVERFFSQYKMNYGSWSKSTRGRITNDTTKALGSVANLYDNILKFPKLTSRTVMVRHINVGSNTVISTDIIENAIKNGGIIKSNDLTINATNPDEIIDGILYTGNSYPNYIDSEYYPNALDTQQGLNKSSLETNKTTYKCMGYNMSVASSLETAMRNIATKINNRAYEKGSNVSVAGKDITAESDYIVIDFYYTEYEKDVEVNHIYIDQDGYIRELEKQTIEPNTSAKQGTETIDRINTSKYISEVYPKRRGLDITVRTADSVASNEDVTYIGHEKLKARTDIKDIVGKQRTLKELSKEQTVNINGEINQVNFYYQIEKEVELAEPEKEIGGSVFVKGKNQVESTECIDDEQLFVGKGVMSVPSGADVTIGVKDIPKYMLAAVNMEYVSPITSVQTAKLTATFKMGNETKSVYFKDIQYRVGYYKITDMTVFKLNNVTMYDAGEEGTTGSSLFTWDSQQVMPKDMNLKVEMRGIRGIISKNGINTLDNYVSIRYEDSEGKEFTRNRTYLEPEQLADVDADGNGKVTEQDKTYVENKLEEYAQILADKQADEQLKQNTYNNVLDEEKQLKDIYDNAKEELEQLKEAYDIVEASKTSQLSAINKLNDEIIKLDKTLVSLNQQLKTLEQNESLAQQAKLQAEQTYTDVLKIQTELYTQYEKEVNYRNTLKNNANCNDSLDEEVYIYVDIYKEQIEAAEKCRIAKQQYEQNIADKVVEKALEQYNNYTQKEVNDAELAIENLTAEYSLAIKTREDKQSEISSTSLTLSGKQIILDTLNRNYEEYIKETYTPAKNAYNSYNENEYATAEKDYNDYVDAKHVETALDQLNAAKVETKQAQSNYDSYNSYRNKLLDKFDEYKALYDEFAAIDENDPTSVAKLLGLHVNISVKNMSVKLIAGNETIEIKADNDSAQGKFKLEDLLKSPGSDVYQVKVEGKPIIRKTLYSGFGKDNEGVLLEPTDYNNSYKIEDKTTNGIRALAAKVEYVADTVIGNSNEIKDNIYYSEQSKDINESVIFKLNTTSFEKTYKVKTSSTNDKEKYEQTEPVNIYTPITVTANMTSEGSQIVNQIKDEEIKDNVIQLNTPFELKLGNGGTPAKYPQMKNTSKYNGGYYVKFDFDVHKVKINGKTYNSGKRIAAGTWIGLITGSSPKIVAQAYGNLESNEQGIVTEKNSYYTVRAVAYNATDVIKNESLRYKNLEELKNSEMKNTVNNICLNPTYFAEKRGEVIIVNRLYDFRVTDIKDVNWKNVFRYSTSENTNVHKEILYYSGTTKWDTTSSTKANKIINRTSSEIGRNPLRILPIGPYKNTDTTYIKAPKIGYRFSFDMKVTGSYYERKIIDGNTQSVPREKMVNINTKFYFISKDGKRYIPEVNEENNGTKAGIYLFYKTSSGNYVRIGEDNSDDYELRFTPNDGYRYIKDSDISTLAKTSVKLGGLRNLTLKHNMATVSNNGAIITYYGEYKLPNSTIAVEVDKYGNYNINKPLTNGYIGVVFDISAIAGKIEIDSKEIDVELFYSQDTAGVNTSQWDYEGFLGYTKVGSQITKDNPLTLKLEKGIWSITDNKLYKAIKGTVMLYDIDERAATDYE